MARGGSELLAAVLLNGIGPGRLPPGLTDDTSDRVAVLLTSDISDPSLIHPFNSGASNGRGEADSGTVSVVRGDGVRLLFERQARMTNPGTSAR